MHANPMPKMLLLFQPIFSTPEGKVTVVVTPPLLELEGLAPAPSPVSVGELTPLVVEFVPAAPLGVALPKAYEILREINPVLGLLTTRHQAVVSVLGIGLGFVQVFTHIVMLCIEKKISIVYLVSKKKCLPNA